jgi:hypothetical protein
MSLELDFNSIAYDMGIDTGMYIYQGVRGVLIDKTFIESVTDNVLTIHSRNLIDLSNTPLSTVLPLGNFNSGVYLTTNSNPPITGNSPMDAKITYTTGTFGA